MTQSPGLSIVITYYKGENFIFNCLDSVLYAYQLSSRRLNFEIILVIDSMEDADQISQRIYDKYHEQPITILKNRENIGVSSSRNFGLSKIRYDFYTIIDQDDYVLPEYFSTLESKIDSSVPIYIINGVIKYINDNIEVPIYSFKPKFKLKNLLLKLTYIYTPGLMIFNSLFIPPRNLFLDTSKEYKGCDDWAAYLNILLSSAESVHYEFIKTPLFAYCLHSSNYSNNKEEMIRSSIAVLNYMESHYKLDKHQKDLLIDAKKMQDFYISRDVDLVSKLKLFVKYPRQFLFQYFYSLFSLDTANKVLLKLSYSIKSRH